MLIKQPSLAVVIPAAGVGKRMEANCPKQYLTIASKTILEHTVERLLSHAKISKIIIALGENDQYFSSLSLKNNPNVETVLGGKERVDSVLAGLKVLDIHKYSWVLVHDAARPCVTHQDINNLIEQCFKTNVGGLLAVPVRDTMKKNKQGLLVDNTIDRSTLWHAFTPQMYPCEQLTQAIEQGLKLGWNITDESSAIELAGFDSQLIEGRSDNIKITRADDLAFAAFILNQQNQKSQKIKESK
jgi:2-C-methyl-D-erythritol 4-phosphate cytidylyltransferase